jgi:hypothetical protein
VILQAERKGASATEYGLVFGIFELVVFIVSPIYGQNVSTVPAHKVSRNILLGTVISPDFFFSFSVFLFLFTFSFSCQFSLTFQHQLCTR